MTIGYKNLHLYLLEAMKLLMFPTAKELREQLVDHKDIAKKVLAMRPYIKCKRDQVVKQPSIIRAEFDDELARTA